MHIKYRYAYEHTVAIECKYIYEDILKSIFSLLWNESREKNLQKSSTTILIVDNWQNHLLDTTIINW